jgi:hypothetical protein
MTLDDVLARIMNYELLLEEAKYVKNLSKGIVSTKRDDIALKAIKTSKKKQILIESSSEKQQEEYEDEEKEYDEEDMCDTPSITVADTVSLQYPHHGTTVI